MRISSRAVLVAMTLLVPVLSAQQPPRPAAKALRRGPLAPGPKAVQRPRAVMAREMILHLMSVSPAEQRAFMENNPRFQRLPPRQQENIRRRLADYNSLAPARREALRERFELFGQLPPEQQDRARELYHQWNQFAPRRRQQLRQGFRELREAAPEERQRLLDGEEFRNRYPENERQVLRGLTDLLPDHEDF
jgi:hypothetical protein